MSFKITSPSKELNEILVNKVNQKTKPPGSLGRLEEMAIQIGNIQQTVSPEISSPVFIVFAADNGIAKSGVSPFPQEVTGQMVMNFLHGGAAINVFCKQHEIAIKIVDAGVAATIDHPHLLKRSMGKGTANILEAPAMSVETCMMAIQTGAEIVNEVYSEGTNMVGFGEMGIGNTSTAALLMSKICNLPIEKCTGKGTGHDQEGLSRKTEILGMALAKHNTSDDPIEILSVFGGFDIAMMVGAMLQCAELKITFLLDGFIATAALLIAHRMHPQVKEYCIPCHLSEESGHKLMLEYLELKPLLNLGMRLGEGSGAAVAFPLIKSAVAFLNEMASFESAGVSNKND